jgi:hypothetical protein
MDTMMGVKQALDPDLEQTLGSIAETAPKYSVWTKLKVVAGLMHKGLVFPGSALWILVYHLVSTVYFIDSLVDEFFANFNHHYEKALKMDFDSMSLVELMDYLKHLYTVCTGIHTCILLMLYS